MQRQRGRRKGGLGLAFLALTMGVLLLSGPALAETKTWIPNSGMWSYDPNWTPSGVPVAGDDVFLTQSGTTNKTVTYKNTAPTAPVLNSLTIDATGTGKMTLNQGAGGYAHPLASLNEYVGYSGTGTHLQSLGTNTISNSLYLGYSPGSNGTYTLSGSALLQAYNIYVGNNAGSTGTFNQSGGTVGTANLTIGGGAGTSGAYNLQGGTLAGYNSTVNLNIGGTFNQTGGDMFVTNFNQNGGTVTGVLTNPGAFNYNGGVFNGRLVIGGDAFFNADFTAENGVTNCGRITIFPSSPGLQRFLTFNGAGLDNNGIFNMTLGGLTGSGPMVNHNWMNLNWVNIWGIDGLTNHGVLQVTNSVNFMTGPIVNNGEIRLVYATPTGNMPPHPAPIANLNMGFGVSLENNGTIFLNNNLIRGGTLNNHAAGIITGNGYIQSNFVNDGVVNMGGGPLNLSFASTNNGVINLNGLLTGEAITNYGTLNTGFNGGTVNNNLVNHGMVGIGTGAWLGLAGVVTNAADGQISVRNYSKLDINQGLAVNDGLISISNSVFDNVGHTLANNGNIVSQSGSIMTGGLTNNSGGKVYLTGTGNGDMGNRVTGDVTNNSGGTMVVEYDPAVFTGNVTNNGTFKVTATHYTCLGTFTAGGGFISDPAQNYFTDLVINPQGYLVGGEVNGIRDQFFISNDFINQSQQTTLWNTVAADLAFTTGTADNDHQFLLPGADLGGAREGFNNNFAWGSLDITGQDIYLADGNADTAGAAQYVGLLLGALLNGDEVINIFGANGLDIFYDPLLAGNAYLGGLVYDLQNGGYLAPVTHTPLPPTLWMVLSGLAGLGMLRRRKVNKS